MDAEIGSARAALVAYARRMLDEGLVVGSAGNLSIRVGDVIAITPTSVPYTELAPEQICLLDMSGEILEGDRPSSEWHLHRSIYELPGAGAVVHTHSPWAVTVSASFPELPAIHYSIVRLGGDSVPVAPYSTYGSHGLAQAAFDVLRPGRHASLLQNHGAVTYGASLAEAFDRAVLLEWLARVYCQAKLLGDPAILSAAQLEDVRTEHARRRSRVGAAT